MDDSSAVTYILVIVLACFGVVLLPLLPLVFREMKGAPVPDRPLYGPDVRDGGEQ